MKTSLIVSRILHSAFAVAMTFTLASTTWAEDSTIDLNHETLDLISDAVNGTTSGVTVDNASYVKEISSDIVVSNTDDTATGDIITGLLIDGNNLYKNQLIPYYTGEDDTTSTVDVFSGTIEVTSEASKVYGIALDGDRTTVDDIAYYTGGNTLGTLTADSKVSATSATGNVYAVYNQYSTINSLNGTIDAKSGGDGYACAYYSTGTTGSITGELSATQTGAGESRTIWNASMGTTGATITSIDAIINSDTESGTSLAIYNLGKIDSITGELTSTSTSGVAQTIFNDYWGSIAYGTIGSISGDITAISAGNTYGIYNESIINTINADITSTSGDQGVGIYSTGSTAKLGDISGSITVVASGLSSAIYNISGSSIESIDAALSATSSTKTVYTIANWSSSTIGNISGSIEAQAQTSSYAIVNQGSMGSIDAEISSNSTTASSYGVYNSGTMDDVNASIYSTSQSTSSSYSAYGIGNSGTMGNLSGEISAEANYSSYAISNSGSIDCISGEITADADYYACGISNDSTIASVDASISVNGLYADAIYLGSKSTIGTISGTITAQTQSGEATGIWIVSGATMGDISANITATATGSGTAYGIYTENARTLSFGEATNITATSATGDAYSLYCVGSSLSIDADNQLNLIGSISVKDGAGALSITNGFVSLSAGSTIEAASISIKDNASLALIVMDSPVLTSDGVTISNEGAISLSAGVNLVEGEVYAISANTELDFNNLGDVTAYGGTISGNNFTVASTQTLYLDSDSSSGVTLQENNARVEVTTDPTEATSDDTSTTIVMNFNASIVDESGEDKTITVSAVTTVTSLEEITLTTTSEGSTTETVINTLDQSFADFIEETAGTNLTIEAAEAYYFGVSGLELGDSVELVFEVGEGYDISQFTVYHLEADESSWEDANTIDTFTYDGQYLYVYVENFSSYGYSIMSFNAIPEPSTATLSLLALAALCARRRRSRRSRCAKLGMGN